MADEFAEIRELREKFMRAAYRHRQAPLGTASMEDMMHDLGLNPHPRDNYDVEDRNLYYDLARYWVEWGCIEGYADGYRRIRITARGLQYVEEGEPTVSQGPTITIAGNVYGSPIATSGGHVEMHNVFTFGDLERLIEERGGDDREALHEMAQESGNI
jgi:hypothetical protein